MKRFLIFFVLLFASSELCAQSWGTWQTIPVFDGERVMPLRSFADQIVKDICGTSRPFIRLDDYVLDDLIRLQEEYAAAIRAAVQAQARKGFENTGTERDSPFNHNQDKLLTELKIGLVSETAREEAITENVRQAIGTIDPVRLESVRRRIESLIPPEGRYFDSSELLLSWLGEPEVWNFIPIFDAGESDYRSEVLKVELTNRRRYSLHRIAPVQLEKSREFNNRLRDAEQKQDEQRELSRYEIITLRIHRAQTLYKELTFHPQRSTPTRMVETLWRTTGVSTMRCGSFDDCWTAWTLLWGIADNSKRFLREIDDESMFFLWGIDNDRMFLRRIGDNTKFLLWDIDDDSPSNSKQADLHPTTERWKNILRRIGILTAAFSHIDARGNPRRPNLDAVQRQFESLLELIDANLDESAALMEMVYPGQQFRKETHELEESYLPPALFSAENRKKNEVRKHVLRYHYSTKVLRREIEAAYLALFDNGRSLRVLPIISEQAIGGDAASIPLQPWATLQTVLNAEDVMIRRFLDPKFNRTILTTASDEIDENIPQLTDQIAVITAEETIRGNDLNDELERELFEQSAPLREIGAKAPSPDDSIRWIRLSFERLVLAYEAASSDPHRSDSGRRFTESAGGLRDALREVGERCNDARRLLIDPEDVVQAEVLRKTNYPPHGATYTEYRYFKLAPFYWMWVFAACSAFFTGLAMMFRRTIIPAGESHGRIAPAQKASFTHSAEEYLYWTAIAFLLLSAFVTFLGGMMRAWITGWAPMTNMYETVVLSAFSAALFGLWYALYPLLNPVFALAWRLSGFPSFPSLMSNFTVGKAAPTAEQNGENAMHQATIDYGVPDHARAIDPDSDPEETARLVRRRNETYWRFALMGPRLILMALTLYVTIRICYGEYAHEHGEFAAMLEMLKMQDPLDWIVVVACLVLVVWFMPRFLLTIGSGSVLLFHPGRLAAEVGIISRYQPEVVTAEKRRRSELSGVFLGETNVGAVPEVVDNSWVVWLNGVRKEILDRKLYILVGALVAMLAGLAAHYNSTQFNPNIRPIVAVLRSNFWLTVHVIAIILSYAAATIAWGMALIATGSAIFGQYRRETTAEGKRRVLPPTLCEKIAPSIQRLLRIAVVLLALGTILGGRWADYSWGRFWGWDPKEVWALITLLFFLIVLHGRIGRLYGQLGIAIGGLFGVIAVIMTWYGINFVMSAGKHAYGGGTAANATFLLIAFVLMNLLWGAVAMTRYGAEILGTEQEKM